MLFNDKEYLEEAIEIERTFTNLTIDILTEEGNMYDNLKERISKWATSSMKLVSGKMKKDAVNTKNRINMMQRRSIDESDLSLKDGTRMLKNPKAFNDLANFIKSSYTFEIATFSPSEAKKKADYLIFAQRNNKKIQNVHTSIQEEITSKKCNQLSLAVKEFNDIEITSENQYKSKILPQVKILGSALEMFEDLAEQLARSMNTLVSSIPGMSNKIDSKMISTGYRKQKQKDELYNMLSAICYANKILANACKSSINQIKSLIEYYDERFGSSGYKKSSI